MIITTSIAALLKTIQVSAKTLSYPPLDNSRPRAYQQVPRSGT